MHSGLEMCRPVIVVFFTLLSVFGVSIPHLPAQSESIHTLTEDTLVSDHTDLQFLSLVPKQRPLVPLVQFLTGQRLSQDLPGVKGQKGTWLQMQWICSSSIWIYLFVQVVTWRGFNYFRNLGGHFRSNISFRNCKNRYFIGKETRSSRYVTTKK